MIISITCTALNRGIELGHTIFVTRRKHFPNRDRFVPLNIARTRRTTGLYELHRLAYLPSHDSMAMSHVVLIDMDNTLVNFDAEFARRWASRRPKDDINKLLNRKYFELEKNFDDETQPVAIEIMSEAGFFMSFEPIPGAIEAVKTMVDDGLSVFFCTAPLPLQWETCVAEKYAWVRRHFGEEYLSKIIITRDKTVVKGAVLIDDKPLIKGACNEPEWKHIVFTQSYNKDVATNTRLNGWSDWRQVVLPLVVPKKAVI